MIRVDIMINRINSAKRVGWWLPMMVFLVQTWSEPARSAQAEEVVAERSLRSFLRFESEKPGEGQVSTALRTYRRADGVEVALVSVVHVGDRAYYEELQAILDGYDALLYEMIRDPDVQPGARVDTDNALSRLQMGMKVMLALEFQLEAIRYDRPNFVHADLDPDTFFRLQAERGESLMGLMLRVMLEEHSRQTGNPQATLNGFQLLMAFLSPDRAHALKLVLGQQMDQMESLLVGIDQGQDGQGSVLVSGRNEHAIRVLEQQIEKGKRNLGIFYGAGHMPDFERRLKAMGFEAKDGRWLVAWDIRRQAAEGL
jgi:hypothetical protein